MIEVAFATFSCCIIEPLEIKPIFIILDHFLNFVVQDYNTFWLRTIMSVNSLDRHTFITL